jgi:hypothetical protein
MEDFRQTPFGRVLARWTQLLIVAGIAVIVAGIFGIGSLMSRFVMARSNASAPETQSVTTVGLGQYINSAASGASNPVFSIGDMSKVWLLANVSEADAPSMQLGQAVEVHVLAFPVPRVQHRIERGDSPLLF